MDHIEVNGVEVNGRTYISARRASEVSGYNSDYLGQLCRERKIKGTRVGRGWFIDSESLQGHMKGVHGGTDLARTDAHSLGVSAEVREVGSSPQQVSYDSVSRLGWGEVSKIIPDDAPLLPTISKSERSRISGVPPAPVRVAAAEATLPVEVPVTEKESVREKLAPKISKPIFSSLYLHTPKLLSASSVFSAVAKVAAIGSLVGMLSFTVATAERHISFSVQPDRTQLAALAPLEMVEVEKSATTSTATASSSSPDGKLDESVLIDRFSGVSISDATVSGVTNLTNTHLSSNATVADITSSQWATSGSAIYSNTGNVDVGTIDSVYTISGTKYATYGHSTVGAKEEVGVRLEVDSLNTATGRYEHSVDFSTLPRGSDLWLFYQITDFGENWQDLVVTLTPGFDGRVFYQLLPEEKKLVVASTEPGSVSLRLFAGRFGASRWSNLRADQGDPFTNFTLEEKK